MVNENPARAAERALALGYAPADRQEALRTLFALDDRLRAIVRAARDPTIGLMRLTWWGEALRALDGAPAPAEPLLRALAAEVVARGVGGAALERVADGWVRHLEGEPIDPDAYGDERGATLFAAAAVLLGASDERVGAVGAGWALADLAGEVASLAETARAAARARLAGGYDRRWPRALRPLGALGLLARYDLDGRAQPGDPRRVSRLLWHRVSGR